jgi:hypothetical protein
MSVREARALARVGLLLAWLVGVGSPALAAGLQLQWDPSPEPTVTGYRVYIGSASGQYERVEDVGPQTIFVLKNAEPGKRYFFAVTALAGEVSSDMSSEISAVVGQPATSTATPARNPSAGPEGAGARTGSAPALAGQTCLGNASRSCFDYVQIGPATGPISSLSTTTDGLLFFVEDQSKIRLMTAAGQLAVDPAYIADPGSHLAQVVVDPQFARTAIVFVSEVVQRRDGTEELNVLRLRLAGGFLGEAAAIVTGIPVGPGTQAPVSVSPAGVLYVAVPVVAGQRSADAEQVLAFTMDGRPLRDPRSGALVTGAGLPRPVSMWLVDETSGLWLGGRDQQNHPVTGAVDMTGATRRYASVDGDQAATAGPFGVVQIPNRTVLATAPGGNGTILAAVGSDAGTADDRSAIVVLQPQR